MYGLTPLHIVCAKCCEAPHIFFVAMRFVCIVQTTANILLSHHSSKHGSRLRLNIGDENLARFRVVVYTNV